MSARRLSLAGLVSLCVLCGNLALASAPAQAAVVHPFLGQFGSASFSDVQGIAVDQSTGGVFVYDAGAGAVYKFSASGAPEDFSSTKTNAITVPGAGNAEGEIAVDSSTGPAKGDIYVAHASSNVLIFNEAGEQVGELGEVAGQPWGEACGVAVDPSGKVYVGLYPNYVNKYTPTADPVTNTDWVGSLYGSGEGVDVCNVAADSSGNAYVDTWSAGPVTRFEALQFNMLATQASGTRVTDAGSTLAVDPATSELYVDQGSQVVQFNAAGESVDAFANSGPGAISESYGVAVDGATHDVFVASGTGQVNVYGLGTVPDVRTGGAPAVAAGRVELEGEVNPGGLPVTLCEFEYGLTEAYGHRVPCETTPGFGGAYVKVTASVTGLVALDKYHFRIVAGSEDGRTVGPDASFTAPLGAPAVESESVVDVAAESATVQAQVDPDGAETTYHVEYGTSGAYGQSTPESSAIGAGGSALPVLAHIEGLQVATTYHYRVVASNAIGQTRGADRTFSTQQGGKLFAMLDGRQYEMVSPPEKHGAFIEGISEQSGLEQAAAGGDAFTFVSSIPTETEAVGFSEHVQNLSVRGAAGWSTRDLTVPSAILTGASVGYGPEYRAFSSDLSAAIVQPLGPLTPCTNAEGAPQPCLSPEASEQTAFLSTDFFSGNVEEPCLQAKTFCARPLVSGCPKVDEVCPPVVEEHADVPPGTVFGRYNAGEYEFKRDPCKPGGNSWHCGPAFLAGTPDLSHVLIQTEGTLEASPTEEKNLPFIYEWSRGHLTLLGEGRIERGGSFGGGGIAPISADGSRVVLKGYEGGVLGLRIYDSARKEELQIGTSDEADFQAMSSDGSRVFFDEHGQLYVFETVGGEGAPLAGTITNLTGTAGLLGDVLGTSEDGSYVYFVSGGVVAGSGATGLGNNLYVEHYTGAEWKPEFIATLSGESDSFDWDAHSGETPEQPTRVSPNGLWLAFMSDASLTGYDNRDAVNGRPDAEVYLYHARGAAAPPTLTCASCNPTGERPTGVLYEELGVGARLDLEKTDAWYGMVAADVPGSQHVALTAFTQAYQSRYLSDGGRLFFNSEDSLVPDDVDGTQDVYEYEPAGAGSCSSSSGSGSIVFEPVRDFEVEGRDGEQAAGCVGLISSGTSNLGSSFLDASQSGADVFFRTAAKLVPADEDSAFDIYDAHECTAASPCPSVPVSAAACETEASCRPAPTPQPAIYGLPASATFSGPGDLVAPPSPPAEKKVAKKALKCSKGFVRKHGRCVRRKVKKARVGDHGRAKR
jgi:hypothetical protein